MERRKQELVLAHKQQEELEQRLVQLSAAAAAGQAPAPLVGQLLLQLQSTSEDLGTAAEELRELETHYLHAREWCILNLC